MKDLVDLLYVVFYLQLNFNTSHYILVVKFPPAI